MKNFTNFKGLCILLAFTAFSTFSFGQKYTGLTAAASDGTTPTVIFDGNTAGGFWQSATNVDDASIVVNLGSIKNVNSIKIYWEAANAKAYDLSFSTDGTNFSNVINKINMAAGNRTDLISGLNIDCKYIKMQGVTRQLPYGYAIFEFEVYPAVVPALTSLAVTPATSSIILGATKQFSVAGLDQLGNAFALTNATTWSVNGTGASVDAAGLFTTTQKGLFTVTATNTGISKTATIDVLPSNAILSIATGVSATATASSGTASLAFDNNGGTRWESAQTDPQWIMVNLGGKKNISDIIISWEGANAKDYIIETSLNGTDFTTAITKTAMPAGARIDRMYGLNFDAQYIRITGTARNLNYGYSIWEFQIYGTVSTATSSMTIKRGDLISVYPNPVTEKINFSEEVSNAAFFSLQGQLIQSVKNTSSINVSTFAKGLYIVRLTDKAGNNQSTKLEIR